MVSQINMFGWDRTRLTTNAADMDCIFVGGKKNLCVEKIVNACTFTPAVKVFIHTGSPIKCL